MQNYMADSRMSKLDLDPPTGKIVTFVTSCNDFIFWGAFNKLSDVLHALLILSFYTEIHGRAHNTEAHKEMSEEVLTDKQIEELADSLLGYSMSIEAALEKMGLDHVNFTDDCTIRQLRLFDSMIMTCELCSYWYRPEELCDNGCGDICRECCGCKE